jgi:hypothetical protein
MVYITELYSITNGFCLDDDKAKKRDLISKLESTIGKIYQYFGASATRTFKLKSWQDLLKIPELKFKKLFHIRWTSIRDSIKPIVLNITPSILLGCFILIMILVVLL